MSKLNKIAPVVLIGLLLLSPMTAVLAPSGGPVGTATADTTDTTTTDTNTTTQNTTQCLGVDSYFASEFLWNVKTCDNVAPEVDVKEDWLNLYSEASYMYSQEESHTDMASNYIVDSREVAFMKAEMAIANAYTNGSISTESEAVIEAREAIRDYYTVKQANLINYWNNQVANLENLDQTEAALSGDQLTPTPFVEIVDVTQNGDPANDPSNFYIKSVTLETNDTTQDLDYSTRSYTLFNGSTMDVRKVSAPLEITYQNDNRGISPTVSKTLDMDFVTPTDTLSWNNYEDGFTFSYTANASFSSILANPPADSQYSDSQIVTSPKYNFQSLWQDFTSTKQDTFDYAESYVAGTWGGYTSGNLNITELLSRYNKIKSLADTGSNATYEDVVASLSSMGLSAPDMSSTAYMNISFSPNANPDTTYNRAGILMSTTPSPNGTWLLNHTYDASQLDGNQLVATVDGSQYTINNTFTIHNAYRPNGTVINDTEITTNETTYVTTNTSELQDKLVEMGETLEEIQERQERLSASGVGGGFSLPDIGIPNPLSIFGVVGKIGQWLSLVALAFVALLLLAVIS